MDDSKFAALDGLVTEVDDASPEAQAQAQATASAEAQAAHDAEERAREWGMVAYTIGSALSMLAPELRGVYTDDACMGWGRSVVPVADKYGWNGPGNVPEIGLLLATAGLAVPSVLAVRTRLAMLKKAREAAEAEARPVEAADVLRSAVTPVDTAPGATS